MKFIHIADVHLGVVPDKGYHWEKSAAQEIRENFIQFIDLLQLNPVDMLFITGDLFDHVPTEGDLVWVDNQLAKLTQTDIVYVTGQSDYLKVGCPLWKYKFISNTYVLNGEPFHNCVPIEKKPDRMDYADGVVDCVHFSKYNLDIYGACQYGEKNTRNDLNGVYPRDLHRINILLAYGGGINASPFQPEDFRNTLFNYIGLGYKHNHQSYKKGNLYYVGSLTPMSEDETGEHGFIKGYVDTSLTSIKFVPFQGRRYLEIEIPVSVGDTRDDIQERIEAVCEKHRNYVYKVILKREKLANTNYDFASIKKKYFITDIVGEKATSIDPEALRLCNANNVLGRHIAFLQNSKEEYKEAATQRYVDAMIDRLSRESLIVKPEPFHDVVTEVADKGVRDSMLKEIEEIHAELEQCDRRKREIEKELKEYPDQTGDLNRLHEKKRQAEYELEKLTFENKYVDENYRTRRMKMILWMDTPIAIILALITTFGLIDVIVLNLWDKWLILVCFLLGCEVLLTIVGFFLYNGSQKFRKKIFGTETPSEAHSRLANEIEILEQMVDQMETEEIERKIHQEKYQALTQEASQIFERQVQLAESSEQLLLILEFKK